MQVKAARAAERQVCRESAMSPFPMNAASDSVLETVFLETAASAWHLSPDQGFCFQNVASPSPSPFCCGSCQGLL